MADGAFSWVFELLDKVSGPAKTMDHQIKEMAEHAEEAFKSLNQLASVEMFKMAYEGAEKLVDKVKELGLEAMRAGDAERTALLSFKALTGSSEGGERLLSAAKSLADKAGVDRKATISQFASLRMAGITDPASMSKMVAASLDIQNKSMGKRSAESVTDMFSTIMTRGQLAGRMLMGMDGLVSAKALGAQLGFNVSTMKQLQTALDKSPVGAAKGIEAIMKVMAGPSGKVGGLSKDIGDGWTGSVTKLKNAWDDVLESVSKTDGFQTIIDVVNTIAAAFDPATDSGKQMRRIVTELIDGIGEMVAPLKDPDTMAALIDGLDIAKNIFLTILQTAIDLVGYLKTAFNMAAAVFSWTGGKIGQGSSAIFNSITGKGSMAEWSALIGGDPDKTERAAQKNLVDPTRRALGVKSPSKVFEQIGRYSAEGFGIGLSSGRMSSPAASLTSMAGFGGGGRPVMSFTINASSTESKALGERARDIVASALAAAFEEISLESGVS